VGYDLQPRSLPRESERASSDGTANLFYHRPLGDGDDVIRLLRINSSLRGDGSVTCDLVQVPLSTAPGYYALSYRWPARCKKEEMITILINGQTFEVHPEVVNSQGPPVAHRRSHAMDRPDLHQPDRRDREGLSNCAHGPHLHRVCAHVCMHSWTRPQLARPPLRTPSDGRGLRNDAEEDVYRASTMSLRLRDTRNLHDYTTTTSLDSWRSLGNRQEWQSLHDLLSQPWFSRL